MRTVQYQSSIVATNLPDQAPQTPHTTQTINSHHTPPHTPPTNSRPQRTFSPKVLQRRIAQWEPSTKPPSECLDWQQFAALVFATTTSIAAIRADPLPRAQRFHHRFPQFSRQEAWTFLYFCGKSEVTMPFSLTASNLRISQTASPTQPTQFAISLRPPTSGWQLPTPKISRIGWPQARPHNSPRRDHQSTSISTTTRSTARAPSWLRLVDSERRKSRSPIQNT